MRRTLSLLFLTVVAGHAQFAVDGGPAWKDFAIRFEPKIEPGDVSFPDDGGSVIDAGVHGNAQRFIRDDKNKRTFGYEVVLQPSADGATAQLRIEPLHDPEHALRNGWPMGSLPVGLPKYPVIPGLKVGDTVALDLMVNPSTGQKLVDYLTLFRAGTSGEPPRDFSLADVWLTIDKPSILVDGKPLVSMARASEVAGRVVAFSIRGRGSYVFSLFPNDKLGFRRNGTIESKVLTFQDDGNTFRIECATPIAPGTGPYNLYVAHSSAIHLIPGMPGLQFGFASGNAEAFLPEPRK
jgi:hypothetical protein